MRGLNERVERLMISSLFRDWKVDIVCLQETKLEFVSWVVVCSLWVLSISLIPKKAWAMDIKYFRPTSLMGGDYKSSLKS